MKRDYAKTSLRYNKKRRTAPIWYALFGIVMGAAIMGGAFWKYQGGAFPDLQAFKKTTEKSAKAPKQQAQKTVSTPRFDFYTLLPQDEVEVPGEVGTQQAMDEKPTPNVAHLAEKTQPEKDKQKVATRAWENPNFAAPNKTLADAKKNLFYLQAGVFTYYGEADRLKARLGMMGQASTIRVQQQNGLKTYRVMLGPFGNRTTASVKQLDLAKNQVSTFVIGE